MDENKQQQYGMNAQSQSQSQNEEVVEFKSQNPEIPQDVEFKPEHQLEEKIEENLEERNR